MSALLPVINHLIQQNPEHQYALSEFSGKSLSVQIAGFFIHSKINQQGFLESSLEDTDTQIKFHNTAVQKLLQGKQPGVGDISIEGDLMLGMSLLPILGGLRYYANDDLSRLLGDAATGSIINRAAVIGHTVRQIGKSIAEQINDFSKEPESPVINQEILNEWIIEVDKLRDDVARLHARLDQLEKNT